MGTRRESLLEVLVSSASAMNYSFILLIGLLFCSSIVSGVYNFRYRDYPYESQVPKGPHVFFENFDNGKWLERWTATDLSGHIGE